MTFDSREDFLNSRRGKIGASDACIIMGVSPWSTPYQLFRQKLDLDPPNEMKPHMQEGLDIEDEARDWFYKKTKIKVLPYQVKHKNIPYMIASLDGLSECGQVIVEIKRPSWEDHEFTKKHNIPPKKYWPQLQHQLSCNDTKVSYYLSYYKDDPFLLTIDRDQHYIDSLIGKEAEFFYCMQNLIEPDLCDRDFILRSDEEWIKSSMAYKEYQYKISEMETEMIKIKKRLQNLSNGKNCRGAGISISHVTKKGSIDYKIIPELNNIDVEKYRKESITYCKINVGK